MDWIQSLILGVVEGLSEFAPISSTGHLIVLIEFLGIAQSSKHQALEMIIQFGAILALFSVFRNYFKLRFFLLWVKVSVAFLPIGFLGLFLSKWLAHLFRTDIVAWAFIVGGVVFVVVEWLYRKKKVCLESIDFEMNSLSFRQAFIIGCFQAVALIPGSSRAGMAMIGAMSVGLSRQASVFFSFLLALPVMVASSLFFMIRDWHSLTLNDNGIYLAVSFITSFLSACLVLKYLIPIISRFSLIPFAIYRIVFGLGLLMVWFD